MGVSSHLIAKVQQKDPMLVVTPCIKNQSLKHTILNLDYKSILIQKSFSSTILIQMRCLILTSVVTKRLQNFHRFSIIFWVLESSIQIAISTLHSFSLGIMTLASSTVSQSQCPNSIRCCRAKEFLLVVIEDGTCQLIEEFNFKHHIFQDGFPKKWN